MSNREKPVRASEVAPSTEKSPDEIRRDRVRDAVHKRMAKRETLRRLGADVAPSGNDVAGTMAHRLTQADKRVQRKRADAKAAVAAKLQGK